MGCALLHDVGALGTKGLGAASAVLASLGREPGLGQKVPCWLSGSAAGLPATAQYSALLLLQSLEEFEVALRLSCEKPLPPHDDGALSFAKEDVVAAVPSPTHLLRAQLEQGGAGTPRAAGGLARPARKNIMKGPPAAAVAGRGEGRAGGVGAGAPARRVGFVGSP